MATYLGNAATCSMNPQLFKVLASCMYLFQACPCCLVACKKNTSDKMPAL
jgi:hypothetical protein